MQVFHWIKTFPHHHSGFNTMPFKKRATSAQSEGLQHSADKSISKSVRKFPGRLASLGLVSLLSFAFSNPALAATAPPLGSTSGFGIVSNTFTNNGNPTTITGSVCYTTAPVTPPTTITGATKTPCTTEIADQGIALANLDGQLGTCISLGAAVDLSAAVVGGGTPGVIPPGCYSSTGAMSIGSTVTLNGGGVYVFRPGAGASVAALNAAAGSIVNLNGGACAANVFWAPTAATTLGANSTFFGTIIDAAGITMGLGASLSGRALAAGGTVTTNANAISVPGACAPLPALPSIKLTKVSNGGVGTFSFSGNNGFVNQSITTVTSGTGVAGATQTLTAAGVPTTITEAAPPAGYTLTSISCSGLGAGGTQTPNIATRSVTLDAAATAAGAAIACTFTNNLAGFVAPAASIPTLSEWAMILLAGLMAIAGFAAIRRKGM